MDFLILLVILIAFVKWLFKHLKEQPLKNQSEDKESLSQRQDYYRNVYLKSDAWRRKRYVVLKRDNWRCVYCGAKATQVHHTRYAKINIGKEPIEWLVSVCKPCYDEKH
jgi:5-methylcytosine-specific restriction endonuclease McrA